MATAYISDSEGKQFQALDRVCMKPSLTCSTFHVISTCHCAWFDALHSFLSVSYYDFSLYITFITYLVIIDIQLRSKSYIPKMLERLTISNRGSKLARKNPNMGTFYHLLHFHTKDNRRIAFQNFTQFTCSNLSISAPCQ